MGGGTSPTWTSLPGPQVEGPGRPRPPAWEPRAGNGFLRSESLCQCALRPLDTETPRRRQFLKDGAGRKAGEVSIFVCLEMNSRQVSSSSPRTDRGAQALLPAPRQGARWRTGACGTGPGPDALCAALPLPLGSLTTQRPQHQPHAVLSGRQSRCFYESTRQCWRREFCSCWLDLNQPTDEGRGAERRAMQGSGFVSVCRGLCPPQHH